MQIAQLHACSWLKGLWLFFDGGERERERQRASKSATVALRLLFDCPPPLRSKPDIKTEVSSGWVLDRRRVCVCVKEIGQCNVSNDYNVRGGHDRSTSGRFHLQFCCVLVEMHHCIEHVL